MSDLTQILNNIDRGESGTSDELLPVVYTELRALAAQKISQEKPGATLQATALVHEAFLRLVGTDGEQNWSHRGHFFGAAAEAMRRILVEAARSKSALKRGGGGVRQELHESAIAAPGKSEEVLAIHEALDRLEVSNFQAAQLVKLRYFSGFSINDSAQAMNISPRECNQLWAYARVWLIAEIGEDHFVTSA